MLKKRIIPALLLKDGRMVKGVNFTNFRDTGNPVTAAKVYNAQKVDELVFLDIEPSRESREKLYEIVKSVASECFMPLTVGGGISTMEEIKKFISIGADKISINTSAIENPDFIREASEKYGNQCIVVSIDYKMAPDGSLKVYSHSGKRETNLDPLEHAIRCEALGAGEILLTNIDLEGTMKGYDFEMLCKIHKTTNIPIIASGGAGNLNHFLQALADCDISAVSAGSIFHFTDQSPIKARFFLYDHDINIRIK